MAKTIKELLEEIKAGNQPKAAEIESEADGFDAPIITRPMEYPREMCEPPGVVGDLSRYISTTARCERPPLSLAASIALWGALFGKRFVTEEHSGNRTNFYVLDVVESNGGKDHPQRVLINIAKRADAIEIFEAEVTSDTAIEEAVGSGWGVKLFVMDECGEFLKGASAGNRNASAAQASILECLKKLYSAAGSTYVSKRKVGQPRKFITEPQANFFGSTTPDRFAAGMSPDEIEGGWTGRCLVFMADGLVRSVNKPQTPYPEELIDAVRRFAPAKEGTAPAPRIVYFTEDAKAVYERFDDFIFDIRERLQAKRDPFRPIWGKVVENAKKLGLLYACSRSAYDSEPEPSIDADAAQWACSVAYTSAANLYLFASEHGGGSEYAELKSWAYRTIKGTGTAGISRRELGRLRRSMRTEDRDEVIDDLIETGEVVEREITTADATPGRKPAGLLVAACWTNGVPKTAAAFCPDWRGQNTICPGHNATDRG